MIKHQMFIAVALLAGVAIGYFVKNEPVAAVEPPKAEERAKKPVADKGEEASVKALRARIADLEKQLAERASVEKAMEIEPNVTSIVETVKSVAKDLEPDFRDRLEEMKKNDPERYERMRSRFAQWRQSRAEQTRSKLEFLSSVNTAHMSAEAKKTHAALQELIAKREEIETQLQDPDLSLEERGNLMRQLWEGHGELQRLNGEERQNLIDATARELGFEGEDAKDVTSTIQEVIRVTDSGWGGGRRGGGPRGGDPRGGGPRGAGGPGGR